MTIINNNTSTCQALSAQKETKSPNFYKLNREFLGDCTDFIININYLKDSPWTNGDIVRWATVKQKISLGKSQRKLLQFLQYRYFRKNQPCFVKQTFIAKELNMHRSQVNRTLRSLEDKGLITKITWLYKGRRKNAIILPLIPSLNSIFTKNTLPNIDFQKCYIKCNNLFCKPSKLHQYPKSFILYTNLLYTNKLFNNNKVNINYIGDTVLKAKANLVSSETKKVRLKILIPKVLDKKPKGGINEMLDKFLLKRKEHSKNNAHQHIFNKLKMRSNYDFDKLSVPDQNDLNTYVDFFHGINIKTHFKISPRNTKNEFYNNYAKEVRSQLLKLIANGHELQWEYADKVIEYWNSQDIDDKRFQRIRLDHKDTKAYKNSVIAISHCLIYPAQSRLKSLFKAIDRLSISQHTKKPPFTWRSNITVDKFFTNLNDPYLNVYLGSETEFYHFAYQMDVRKHIRDRVNIGLKQFVEMYVNQFYSNDKERGMELCYRFEGKIKRWLESRIDEIIGLNNTKVYRNMEGYSLIEDRLDDGVPLPPLLQRFFFYIYNTKELPKITYLLDDDIWKDFIETHMRIEIGLNRFYKILQKN